MTRCLEFPLPNWPGAAAPCTRRRDWEILADAAVAADRDLNRSSSSLANPPAGALDRRLRGDVLAQKGEAGPGTRDERELACDLHATLDPLGVRFDGVREIANVPVGRLARKLELEGTYRAELDRLLNTE